MRAIFWPILFFTLGASAQTSTSSMPIPSASASERGVPKWSGDLRLRADNENNDGNDARLSEKFRLRLDVKVPIDEKLRAELRLMAGQNARSGNQTMGDSSDPGFTRRYIGLDLAYAEWSPLSFFKLVGGRIPQVHERPGGSQLILDEDISLEGGAILIEQPLGESWKLFGNTGSVLVRENYEDKVYFEDQTDNALNWAQVGIAYKTDRTQIRLGGGFFNYVAFQGTKFSDLSTGATAKGNSEKPTGTIKDSFIPREVFVDGSFKTGEWDWGPFVEYLINDETNDPNRAWWVGFNWARGPWDGQLAYRETATDVVPALFTWDDFAAGNVDSRGVVLNVRWKFAKNMNVKLTEFFNRLRYSSDNAQYIRTHLDLSMSF